MNTILEFLSRKDVGLAAGLTFTSFVAGLIVYGNLSTSTHEQNFEWEYRPSLYVCDTAPVWAQPDSEDLQKALTWWADHGYSFDSIEFGPCPKTCTFFDERLNLGRNVACNKGKVTLDLRDKWFGEDHAGECARPGDQDILQDVDWTTILVPNVIFGSEDMDADMLPPDVSSQTLAHEIGHCLVGVGHNKGPSVGCARLNSKTGAVMNPTIYGGGWVDEGLPPSPSEW